LVIVLYLDRIFNKIEAINNMNSTKKQQSKEKIFMNPILSVLVAFKL
jgi:hypothetical protein